ncbi:hypothetical protein C5Z26_08030 [Lactobacillus sp. CBA3606]|uniref:PTS sugar transporter subunit IIA domain-containing protein n=1 Tax=Lactobacillus sp. CBA3606 TaxID=2099789 RepID=UPI000CFCBA50|nr:hypothetical protein [Lactobacillus sp. CBA3606]AVK64063.1 hypothetical protein C5Z26_08030 [Lactobacillus sp. CBA3606]
MKLLLVSHGHLASGILTSYHMIAGDTTGIDKLELTDTGVGEFRESLDEYLNTADKVLILADVQGGHRTMNLLNDSWTIQIRYVL